MTNSKESHPPVLTERYDDVEVWRLCRPERRNALSTETLDLLLANANRVPGSGIRSISITGDTLAFSAGADLKERAGMDASGATQILDLFGRTFLAIDTLPIPVLAALDGIALGGGLELALACDLRIAAPGVRVGLPETTLGIIPGAGGTQRLTRLIGPGRAKEWILLGRSYTAEEALAAGVITALADPGETAVTTALRLAQGLARGATVALGAALEAIDAAFDGSLADGLAREQECYRRTIGTSDRLEALAAFREKRQPTFKGR